MVSRSRTAIAAAVAVASALALEAAGCGGRGGHGGGGGQGSLSGAASVGSWAPVTSGSTTTIGAATSGTAVVTSFDLLSPVSVTSGSFRDGYGRSLLLHGVNLSERSKTPPFTGWLQPQHVDAIQALGADHVRFLLTWEAIEPTDGVFDDSYLDSMLTELSWFEQRGIYVVLDMHQDQYARRFGGDGFPSWMILSPDPDPQLPDILAPFPLNYFNPKVEANFDSFWSDPTKRTRLAKAWAHAVSILSASKAVIGYDLFNEPFPGIRVPWDFESSLLVPLEAELAAAIRAQDPDRIIFFEGELQAGLFAPTGLQKPNNDPNCCYAPHWYDPVVDIRSAVGLTAYDGNWNRTQTAFDNLAGHAQKLGTALWLGEYGIERLRGNSAQYLLDQQRLTDARLWPSCCWDVNPVVTDLFSPLDPNGQPYSIAEQWAHPHPRAVAGTLESTSYDPGSRTLEVHWLEGHLGSGVPTIVELPFETYPAGTAIDVTLAPDAQGAWTATRDTATGRLFVTADPLQGAHVLVVRPH